MLVVVFGVLAASCNAAASVLQRIAVAPRRGRRGPSKLVWFGGVAALVGGFLCQAGALRHGQLTLVQALLVVELPMTLLLAAAVGARRVTTRQWQAVLAVAAGLFVFLLAAAPSAAPASIDPAASRWTLVAGGTAAAVATLAALAWLRPGAWRAALLATAAGCGFALTAALVKAATHSLGRGPVGVFGSWSVYAMVLSGMASLALLQLALRAGPLVAVQPALTITDPIASVVCGAALFGEHLRGGVLVLPEIAAVVAIAGGVLVLAGSWRGASRRTDAPTVPRRLRPPPVCADRCGSGARTRTA